MKGPVAVHQRHFELIIRSQLFIKDIVPRGEHLADLQKGFPFGLRNDEDGVDSHPQTDGTEDQVAVRTCGFLGQRARNQSET